MGSFQGRAPEEKNLVPRTSPRRKESRSKVARASCFANLKTAEMRGFLGFADEGQIVVFGLDLDTQFFGFFEL